MLKHLAISYLTLYDNCTTVARTNINVEFSFVAVP